MEPVESRRRQISQQLVPRLHRSAQRILLSSYTIATAGIGASIAASAFALTSAPTAVALGLLSLVTSMAAGQRMWERARRRYWRDWERIIQMLHEDLQVRFQNWCRSFQTGFASAVDARLLAKPTAAADGLQKLLARRETKLDELQRRLDNIRSQLHPPP